MATVDDDKELSFKNVSTVVEAMIEEPEPEELGLFGGDLWHMLEVAVTGPIADRDMMDGLKLLTPTHRFLFLQGALYAVSGLAFFIAPRHVAYICSFGSLNYLTAEYNDGSAVEEGVLIDQDHPEVLVLRFTGFYVALVGYHYFQGARDNTLLMIATTGLNRLINVPIVMVLLMILGADVGLCIFFLVFDPLMTLLTHLSMRGSTWLPEYISRRDDPDDPNDDPVPFRVAGEAYGKPWTEVDNPSVGELFDLATMQRGARAWSKVPLTRAVLSRRIVSAQGVLYAIFGLALVIFPEFSMWIFARAGAPADMDSGELGMMRTTGAVVYFLGYFHVQGARSAGSFFVATVTFSSVVIQPFGLLVLFVLGLRWQICLFATIVPVMLTVARRIAVSIHRLASDDAPTGAPVSGSVQPATLTQSSQEDSMELGED